MSYNYFFSILRSKSNAIKCLVPLMWTFFVIQFRLYVHIIAHLIHLGKEKEKCFSLRIWNMYLSTKIVIGGTKQLLWLIRRCFGIFFQEKTTKDAEISIKCPASKLKVPFTEIHFQFIFFLNFSFYIRNFKMFYPQ